MTLSPTPACASLMTCASGLDGRISGGNAAGAAGCRDSGCALAVCGKSAPVKMRNAPASPEAIPVENLVFLNEIKFNRRLVQQYIDLFVARNVQTPEALRYAAS